MNEKIVDRTLILKKEKLDDEIEKIDIEQYRKETYTLQKRARDFLGITFVDARALKNRLVATTVSELIDVYKDYENGMKLEELRGLLQ